MRQYFKGYYFKCRIGDEIIAFIPALHGNCASLQIITKDVAYFIPYEAITFCRHGLQVKIGNNIFSEKGIYLDMNRPECQIHGKLKFGRMHRPKYSIMGPFEFVPFMQCKHSVVSMHHSVSGKIVMHGKKYQDYSGIGYMEGDRGYSFPTKYVWTQCHTQNESICCKARYHFAVGGKTILAFTNDGARFEYMY